MIDWLRSDHQNPSVEVDGRALPINIRRHPRAKWLTMRLAPDGSELRISMPQWGRTLDALTFAKARTAWIAQQISKVPAPVTLGDGSTISVRGQELTIRWSATGPRKVNRDAGVLTLGGPQDRIAPRLQRWLEAEALHVLAEDVIFYCQRAGIDAPELRLSRAQRRWGSCSSERRRNAQCIRINWRLIMAPDAVRRSVVAHEVTHLIHFDHSPAFYAQLDQLYEGDLPAADAWLRTHGRSLYAAFG